MEFIDPRCTLRIYAKSGGLVARIVKYNGLTIKEWSRELNIRSDKLLELLGYLQRTGRIRDVNFC